MRCSFIRNWVLFGYRPEDMVLRQQCGYQREELSGQRGRCKSLLKTEFEIHANVSVSSSYDVKCPFQKETKDQ